jgi:hypothetical protein
MTTTSLFPEIPLRPFLLAGYRHGNRLHFNLPKITEKNQTNRIKLIPERRLLAYLMLIVSIKTAKVINRAPWKALEPSFF